MVGIKQQNKRHRKINDEESSLQTEIKNEKGIDVLKDIDDITALFEGSSGYCGGLDATTHCSGHDHSCYAKKLRLTNGTIDESDDTFVIPAELCENDATQNDMLCVLLNRNSEAVRYIEGNSTTKAAYGDKDTKETWYYRHEAKHKDWSGYDTPVEPGSLKKNVRSARNSCYDPHNNNAAESGMKTTDSRLAYTYKISELLKAVPDQVTTVTLRVSYEGRVIDQILHSKKSNPANVCDDSTWSSSYGSVSYSAGINHISTIRDKSKQYYKFDLSGCTSEQLEDGWVCIQTCASTSSYNGDGRNYCQCILYEIGYETVMDDCDITKHQYSGTPTYTFDEKNKLTSVKINYECDKNKRNHKDSYTVPKTKIYSTIKGGSIIYKIEGKYNDFYTKVVQTNGSSDPYKAEPILLTNDNTSGSVGQDKSIPSDYGYSDKEVWPSGWGIGYDGHVNSAHYVSASAAIDGSVPAGYIPTGVNQIVFGFSANETLEALSISVYNARGQKIGFGGMNMAGSISGNTCTVKINARSDADLMGATVKFYGKSSSIRWASSHWEKLGGISSSISLNSMTFVY
ncbi:hypothetical protein CIY_03390 [Butyrivibrio fibrisolvens 16/4]|nr:hypothetical protein CIY_03390 [Butyrivibrio fibrisolvens 16/4]